MLLIVWHMQLCIVTCVVYYDNNNKYILRMNVYVSIIYPTVCNPKIKPSEQSVLFKSLEHAYHVYVEL